MARLGQFTIFTWSFFLFQFEFAAKEDQVLSWVEEPLPDLSCSSCSISCSQKVFSHVFIRFAQLQLLFPSLKEISRWKTGHCKSHQVALREDGDFFKPDAGKSQETGIFGKVKVMKDLECKNMQKQILYRLF